MITLQFLFGLACLLAILAVIIPTREYWRVQLTSSSQSGHTIEAPIVAVKVRCSRSFSTSWPVLSLPRWNETVYVLLQHSQRYQAPTSSELEDIHINLDASVQSLTHRITTSLGSALKNHLLSAQNDTLVETQATLSSGGATWAVSVHRQGGLARRSGWDQMADLQRKS